MTVLEPVTLDPAIIAARVEIERTRARLIDTAHELQQRINPKTLAQNAWQDAKDKGADLAEDAVDAMLSRPVAAGGMAAALALFLARGPLIDLAKKMFGDTPAGPAGIGESESRLKDTVYSKGTKPGKRLKPVQTEALL